MYSIREGLEQLGQRGLAQWVQAGGQVAWPGPPDGFLNVFFGEGDGQG